MKKNFYLSLVFLFISFLTGCIGSNASSRQPWKDVKASELISRQQRLEDKSITVGLHIYLFQIQADKLPQIQEQIVRTDDLRIKYNNPDAFLANGLTGCAGDRDDWRKFAELLTQSQPQVKKHINLLISENMPDDIITAEISRPASIIYHSDENTTSGIGFDTGRMTLRIKVGSLLGLRQACRLDAVPVYSVGKKTRKPSVGRGNYEFAFEAAAFNVHLQPGQFILLAPAQPQTDQTDTQTLGDYLFCPQDQNTADMCLIACSLINSPL